MYIFLVFLMLFNETQKPSMSSFRFINLLWWTESVKTLLNWSIPSQFCIGLIKRSLKLIIPFSFPCYSILIFQGFTIKTMFLIMIVSVASAGGLDVQRELVRLHSSSEGVYLQNEGSSKAYCFTLRSKLIRLYKKTIIFCQDA